MKEFHKINTESVPNRIVVVRILFLKGVSLIYLISYLSLYGQIQGLWGNDGLFPSNLFLKKLQENLKGHKYYLFYPTLAWALNLESNAVENLLYILCLFGIIISLLIVFYDKYFFNSISFFILWYIHYNFIILGQIFMRFANDNLLTEIGFVSIFFAPFSFRYVNYIYIINDICYYLLKFILFKFMVSTGVNIIGSLCPYWTSFNGLSFFFQGQNLLSKNSYFFHTFLSDNVKKIISAFGYFCLLYLPIGYFLFWRRISIYAGQITFLFNLFLIFAGNYGVLNLLVIVLNIVNFDDYFFRAILSRNFLEKWGLETIAGLIPAYFADKKNLDKEINKYEEELKKLGKEIEEKNEKKNKDKEIDKEKISLELKELNKKYNNVRKKIIELSEEMYDDGPKLETSLIVESSILKEFFIFINFSCGILLLVYILIYPIKRLVKGVTVIEQVPTEKFKYVLIVGSVYVFIYIIIFFFINLVSKLKNSIFSEKGIMDSLLQEMMEKNKENNEGNNDNNNNLNATSLVKSIKKPDCIKIIKMSIMNIIKTTKYLFFIILFTFYYLGSVKYFLLNIDVELYPQKNSTLEDNDKLIEPGLFQNLLSFSDIIFSNYYVYGIYGNTQKEIQSVLGRSELEIEYMTELDKYSWKTVNFKYKLSLENTEPKFLFFHLPRLDYKLSEVANDEDLNKDSWIIILLGKIFERNPVVLDLLGYEVNEKKFLEKISFFEKIKQCYLGKKKYEIMPLVNKLKVDIFKYQFLKNVKNKDDALFKRKRYKEYLSPIEKHTLVMVYEKLGLPKPDPNKIIKINKFQFIPVVDAVIIFLLSINLLKKKNI